MSIGLTNFKFYRSFRVKTDEKDKVFIKITVLDGENRGQIIHENVSIIDFNLFSMSFKTDIEIKIDTHLKLELYTKKIFNKWDFEVNARVIRSFSESKDSKLYNYGVELLNQNNDSELKYFITDYVAGFSGSKLKKFLIKSALSAREISISDGIELFSLLNVLYKEFNESSIIEIIDESKHLLNCEEVRLWKINVDNDKLENIYSSTGSTTLKEKNFSMQEVGMSFTTSQCINKVLKDGRKRKQDEVVEKSILCLPILNKEQKCVGVYQFINKSESRFSLQDEVTASFLSMVMSKFFLSFSPKSKSTRIAHLNPELEDDFIYFGSGQKSAAIRSTLRKLKYGRNNIHIVGEVGLGKAFFAKELANTSKTEIYNCKDKEKLKELFETSTPLAKSVSIVLKNINYLTEKEQNELFNWSQFHECQIISTTTEDLNYKVETAKFNKLLYKKLSHSLFHITPLRNRSEDILPIAKYFIKMECKKRNLSNIELSPESLSYLTTYSWPGNITQLEKSIIKAFMVRADQESKIHLIEASSDLAQSPKEIESVIADHCDYSIHPYKLFELLEQLNSKKEAS
ncbi:hypothetical protein [Halobacteriovorax sp. HLS]|uniref:hypothetical protein n=1 Tax=Halobacteriovorax sp. HLS TaxID=2234000 RepID=UPI000FDB6C4F|nr:hypothetical protein [Halobacteriovorax sp. HLS]